MPWRRNYNLTLEELYIMKNTSYVSEATVFLRELTTDKPTLVAKQDQLRQTWWDKDPQEVYQEEQLDKTDLPHLAYPYFDYSKTNK